MKPYYEDRWTKIYHGDCREILPQLDVKVDLVLTDFPYGNGTDYGTYEDTQDNLRQLIESALPVIRSKTKRVLLTCGVGNIGIFPRSDWILLWISPAGVGSGKWGFCCWQPILAYGKDPYLTNGLGRHPDTIISDEGSDNKCGHPCPKPLNLWKQVLARGSVTTEDIICDPFMGSGVTIQAAKSLNRYSIGIEISEKYCEIAAKRCSQASFEFDIPTDKPVNNEKQLELQ